MTDNNNVAMNAETPETEIPVAPAPAEAEAPAAQEGPKTGTITIIVTEGEGGHHVNTGIEGSFNGMAFVAGLAGAINAISEAAKVPGFVILSKLIEVYSGNAADVEEEQDDEDKDV
jgi:hypothetical protein